MKPLPHDVGDLLLAPVILQVDSLLEELALLDRDALRHRLASDTNIDDSSRVGRETAVVETLMYLSDMHGWKLSLVERGARLAHGEHALVLGLPRVLREYVNDDSDAP